MKIRQVNFVNWLGNRDVLTIFEAGQSDKIELKYTSGKDEQEFIDVKIRKIKIYEK
jgi:hypothetical protein